MPEDLWGDAFSPANVVTPKNIIEGQCDILSNRTGGKVLAKLESYSGLEIPLYVKSFDHTLSKDKLGEQGVLQFRYEFFITLKNKVDYKYRVFFIYYSASVYPVSLILDETIASEIISDSEIKCNTSEEFTKIFKKILTSKKLRTIIETLMSASQ